MLIVLSVAVWVPLFASCGRGNPSNCGGSLNDTFAGRLTAINGQVATFAVDSVAATDRAAAVPIVGQTVPVRYSNGEARLLRVGKAYRVEIENAGGEYVSDVNDPCTTGTTWPDGSAIRTGSWWKLNRVLLLALLAPVVALLLFGVFEFRDRRGHSWLRREA